MVRIPNLPDPDASAYYTDGGTGNDTVKGGAGNDVVHLGAGDDCVNSVTTGNGTYFGELWRGWQRVHLRIHQQLWYLWRRWQ
jgi:Ca2+-binding RTX toxin-like protein